MKTKIHLIILVILLSTISCGIGRSYKVVSTSMEGTLLVGDKFRIIEKDNYANNDIVAFKYINNDKEEIWMYRIIAQSGDTVEIKNGKVFLNNRIIADPIDVKKQYVLKTNSMLNVEKYKGYEFVGLDSSSNGYVAYLTSSQVAELKKNSAIISITEMISKENSADFFGPIIIPEVGQKININEKNSFVFKNITNQTSSELVTKEKLFFLLGDNRHNAADSRYIGLITQSDIQGVIEK